MNTEGNTELPRVPPKTSEICGINASITASSIRLETAEQEKLRLNRAVSAQEHIPFKSAVPKSYKLTAVSKYSPPYQVNTSTEKFNEEHKFEKIQTKSKIFINPIHEKIPAPTPPNSKDQIPSTAPRRELNPFKNWYSDERAFISGENLKNNKTPLGLYTLSNEALLKTIDECNQILRLREKHGNSTNLVPKSLKFEESEATLYPKTSNNSSKKESEGTPSEYSSLNTPTWISPDYKLSKTGTPESSSTERTLNTEDLNTQERAAAAAFRSVSGKSPTIKILGTPSTVVPESDIDSWAEAQNKSLNAPIGSVSIEKRTSISIAPVSGKRTVQAVETPKKNFTLVPTKYPNWFIKKPTSEELYDQPTTPLWESERKRKLTQRESEKQAELDARVDFYNSERARIRRHNKSTKSGSDSSIDYLDPKNWSHSYPPRADEVIEDEYDHWDVSEPGLHEYYKKGVKGFSKQ